jgi:hypothetical protein
MDEEDKQKLRQLWDFIELMRSQVPSESSLVELNAIQDKFEELFTKELNG